MQLRNAASALAIGLILVLAGSAGQSAEASQIGSTGTAITATCTSSVGPGIPPPSSVPSGVPGFHAAWYGQSGYMTLCPGESATATIAMYNSGSFGWVDGVLGQVAMLGTWNPTPGQDQPSIFGGDGTNGSPNTGWPRYNRVASQPASYVGPNQVAWFQFVVRAPASPGTYGFNIRPLIEGAQWMEDYGIFWYITVPSDSPDTTPPAVTSASTTNAATVLVNFNESMKCTTDGAMSSIATGTNYAITTSGGSAVAETITASANAACTQASLSLSNPLTLGSAYTVTASNVQDTAGNTIGASRSATFTAADTGAPTATAAVTGTNQITVTYGEPMDTTTTGAAANYRLDSVSCTTLCPSVTTTSTTAVLTLTTTPTSGNHILDISNVKDTVGNTITPNPTSVNLNFAPSTTRPTVTGASATNASTVNVAYSTNMDPVSAQTAPNYVIQNANTGSTYSTVSAATCAPSTASCTSVNLTPTASLVAGSYSIVVSNVKDTFNNLINPNPTTKGPFSFSADTTAPAVSSVSGAQTASGTAQVTITFSEAMKHVLACGTSGAPQAGTGPNIDNKGDYVVTNSPDSTNTTAFNAAIQGSTSALITADCRTITYSLAGSFTAGAYSLQIASAQDASGNTVSASTMGFTYTDTVAPALTSVSAVTATSLTANYNKRMTGGATVTNSAGNPNNYQVNNLGYGNLCLTGTASITASADLKSFTVTCSGGNGRWTTTGGNTLTVKDVADYNGNTISPNPSSLAF